MCFYSRAGLQQSPVPRHRMHHHQNVFFNLLRYSHTVQKALKVKLEQLRTQGIQCIEQLYA